MFGYNMLLYYVVIIDEYRADNMWWVKNPVIKMFEGLQDYNSPHVSALYVTPHTLNSFNLRYFKIIHILFYYWTVNFNLLIWLSDSDSDTFCYSFIHVSKI
jgi:hypothetical protein